MANSGTIEPAASLAELVRRHDRDRYQTVLFAPAARRDALFALYAFNYEVARVREIVREPMLGQIRLQWWREVIDAAYAGIKPRRHEVAEPLTSVIRDYDLSRVHFDRLIDAREQDLAEGPPADIAALEAYAEGTSASLLYLVLEILRAADPLSMSAARSVGIGYALTGLLRAMPFHIRSGRNYIPPDLASQAGLNPADYAAMRPSDGLRTAAADLAIIAARHFGNIPRTPRATLPALLPAIIAKRYLHRLRRAGNNPLAPELQVPDPLQVWRLFGVSMTGRP
jgi:phytoene synthase